MHKRRTVFALWPMQLFRVVDGVRLPVRRVWLRNVVQRCTFWDGWIAFADDQDSPLAA